MGANPVHHISSQNLSYLCQFRYEYSLLYASGAVIENNGTLPSLAKDTEPYTLRFANTDDIPFLDLAQLPRQTPDARPDRAALYARVLAVHLPLCLPRQAPVRRRSRDQDHCG